MGVAERPEPDATSLVSAAQVEGATVFDSTGERLGHVEDIMLHEATGKVAYAVICCGGFLGLGEKRLPIPWSLLCYDTQKRGYVLPVERSQLQGAPEGGESLDAENDDHPDGRHTAAAWL